MSRYRMSFFNSRREPLVSNGPTLGIYGESQDAAIAMSQRVWEGLVGEETALGYSLVDTRTGRVCHMEVR